MKVKLLSWEDDYDNHTSHNLFIDDKWITSIHPLNECPEDAIVGRDLVDGNDIIKYIRLGYEAAQRGESLDVEVVECKTEDEFEGIVTD